MINFCYEHQSCLDEGMTDLISKYILKVTQQIQVIKQRLVQAEAAGNQHERQQMSVLFAAEARNAHVMLQILEFYVLKHESMIVLCKPQTA